MVASIYPTLGSNHPTLRHPFLLPGHQVIRGLCRILDRHRLPHRSLHRSRFLGYRRGRRWRLVPLPLQNHG
ncbi:hypothetical protein EMPG_09450 [Blastomyces silverae]|uniref:Uncharacterized protein n=1 Tax=Blastomyces silverae TaxID=2060906 RepID=A0A0H1BPD1_9EURO|nr:hypothetical protein EMPG_09450 [Blastomyces silverae]